MIVPHAILTLLFGVWQEERSGHDVILAGKSSLWFSLSLWLLLLACCSLASPLSLLLLLSCSLRLRQLTHSPLLLAPGQISLLSPQA